MQQWKHKVVTRDHWWVGCYICYSKEGFGRGWSPPSPLLAVPWYDMQGLLHLMHLLQQGGVWAWLEPTQSPPRCTMRWDTRAVTFGAFVTARRGLGGAGAHPVPSSLYHEMRCKGCYIWYIWYSKEGYGRGWSSPSPLLAVPWDEMQGLLHLGLD